MTQEQAVLERTPDAAVRRSLSDRPVLMRYLVHTGRFFRTKPLGGAGVVIIIACVIAGVFGNQLERYDPETIFKTTNPEFDEALYEKSLTDPLVRLTARPEQLQKGETPILFSGPTGEHWLGTDGLGRDLYSRVIHGAYTALYVGLGAALMATISGIVIGLASAYFAGATDFILQRIMDTLQAFPPLVLLLLFGQVVSSPTMTVNTISLGILGVASSTRIVRSAVLATREEVYVLAARTVGGSDLRIMFRHIFPNITAPIIVTFTSSIGVYILVEATLAFLGLGDPTQVSWGKMIEEGRRNGVADPWMALAVGGALTVTVLGFNLAGDALRDVLDPRLRGRGGRAGF
ncbi:MAG: ABC transporter permease [Dehalococcoidia bacterium]|uniref:ABC transporter permease n=1 Tax=Candidatus Amarobacter glycogenicus TaxID=3140699 RepID=UPI001DC68B3E|nr:ABC transporter permease [Dehalococcoidia bacterium]MBK7726083.1 ABC transporter permease [Dehalococcoidia bacterium]MBK9610800.1 ABC transporter permease [Dehalococcoidia bacterium]